MEKTALADLLEIDVTIQRTSSILLGKGPAVSGILKANSGTRFSRNCLAPSVQNASERGSALNKCGQQKRSPVRRRAGSEPHPEGVRVRFFSDFLAGSLMDRILLYFLAATCSHNWMRCFFSCAPETFYFLFLM